MDVIEIDFIVPVCDGSRTIEACLGSLLQCSLPHRVFVVENGSSDRTREVIARVAATEGPRVWWASVPYRSKARAANLALAQGTAPVVWCVDADVVFEHDRFMFCRSALDAFDCLLLTPNQEDRSPSSVTFHHQFAAARDSFLIKRTVATGQLFSPWYSRCGAEDLDLVLRLLKEGHAVGRMWGGFRHLRMGRRMGLRRRIHFVAWNTLTYLRHFDCAYCRTQVWRKLLTWPLHLWEALSEELRTEGCDESQK